MPQEPGTPIGCQRHRRGPCGALNMRCVKHAVRGSSSCGWEDGAGLQPLGCLRAVIWGVDPGWDDGAPLALKSRANGTPHTSVGKRPANDPKKNQAPVGLSLSNFLRVSKAWQ